MSTFDIVKSFMGGIPASLFGFDDGRVSVGVASSEGKPILRFTVIAKPEDSKEVVLDKAKEAFQKELRALNDVAIAAHGLLVADKEKAEWYKSDMKDRAAWGDRLVELDRIAQEARARLESLFTL